jgi:hypothetical protein
LTLFTLNPGFRKKFIASLLARNIDLEEDLGLIDYNGEITVRAELLTDVVLHD